MRLVAIKNITGVIRLRSGLHIGASKDNIEIGGMDQPIIKDPITRAPYIPGSSLKGKLRSLLETSVFMKNPDTRRYIVDGTPCRCGKKSCPDCTIFGSHATPQECEDELGPSRLLVRDASLTDEYKKLFVSGLLPMEMKTENIIDRVKGVAKHPRPLERVPAGTCFTLNMAFRVYEGDSEDLLNYIWKGLKMIELDALGGGGSRGSGQIVFENLQVDGKPVELEGIRAF